MAEKRSTRVADEHGRVLMRLIHEVTARNAERGTMDLSIRERLAVQRLGLEGDLPITALGQRLAVSSSSMTGLADRLEERGYVRRVPHASDRRAIVLSLTRKGAEAFSRELGFYRSLVEETLAPLGGPAMAAVLDALLAVGRAAGAEDAA